MAAYIVCVSDEHWTVIREFLSLAQEGAIVVPPEMRDRIAEWTGLTPRDIASALHEGHVEYDNGGQADVWLDVLASSGDMALTPVLKRLQQYLAEHGLTPFAFDEYEPQAFLEGAKAGTDAKSPEGGYERGDLGGA